MTLWIGAATILGLIVPTVAQAQEHAVTTPVAAKLAAPAKKLCRRIVPTGSMLAKRFCLTPGDWQTFNDINESDTDAAMHKRGSGMCDINCDRPPS